MRAFLIVGVLTGTLLVLPSFAQTLMNTAPQDIVPAQVEQALQSPQATMVNTGAPTRGMTMQQVERDFGVPAQRKAPVGDPPITRWEYQSFIVYFEYRHVIHTVAKR